MGFDLKTNNLADKAEKGYEFELKLPGLDKPTGAFITVRGEKSKTVTSYSRRKFNEYQARNKIARRKGQENDDISLEEAEEIAIEAATIRVISWRGIEEDGKEVPFSDDNAERIFKEHPWIREQVQEEASQLLNFQ